MARPTAEAGSARSADEAVANRSGKALDQIGQRMMVTPTR